MSDTKTPKSERSMKLLEVSSAKKRVLKIPCQSDKIESRTENERRYRV